MVLIDNAKLGALVSSARLGVTTLVQNKGKKADTDQEVLEGELTPEQADKGSKKIQIRRTEKHNECLKDVVTDITADFSEVSAMMTPAMQQVVSSQLQVLNVVSSPTLSGMMLDNVIFGLQKAIEDCSGEEAKLIQESYIRIIQSFTFHAEAKLRYILEKNKAEAEKLLEESLKMVSDSVVSVASMSFPPAKASSIAMKTMGALTSDLAKKDIISSLAKIVRSKKESAEKKEEFYTFIENLFDTFDKYDSLFGKSIVINGMLSKYRKVLVERYTNKRVDLVKNSVSVQSLQKADRVVDDIAKSLNKAKYIDAAASLVKGALSIFSKHKQSQFDLQTYFVIYDSTSRQLAEAKDQIVAEEDALNNLLEERKEIGIFNFSGKKEAVEKIKEQKKVLEEKKQIVKQIDNKLQQLKDLLPDAMAIKSDIDNYEARLVSIEEKYL